MSTENDLQLLVNKVAEMRAAQREYFSTGDYEVLKKSKALERQVDTLIDELKKYGERLPGL